MTRVLLFGGYGLLGGALRRIWTDCDFIVPAEGSVDITDLSSVVRAWDEAQPELVVNCAAWNDVDGAEEHEEAATLVNAHAVRLMATEARQRNVPIIHFSTDYVFDGTNTRGYDEDALPHPINAYGRSKALGEQYLRQETANHFLVRTSRLYGAPPESSRAKKNFVLRILDEAERMETIRSVDEEPGAFTFVDDLAVALKRLVDDHAPFGTYHLTPSGEATWFACAKEIIRICGLKTQVLPASRAEMPVKRAIPPYTVLRSTKVPHLRPWQEALAGFLKG